MISKKRNAMKTPAFSNQYFSVKSWVVDAGVDSANSLMNSLNTPGTVVHYLKLSTCDCSDSL